MEGKQSAVQLMRTRLAPLPFEDVWGSFEAANKEARRRFLNEEMSKDELLHYLRTRREFSHQVTLVNGFVNHPFCWDYLPGNKKQRPSEDIKQRWKRTSTKEPTQSSQNDFWELANKSVPFYILTTPEAFDNSVPENLQRSLCAYLYARWFRPK